MANEKSASKVVVASKLPHALDLRIAQKVKLNEPIPGGGTREREEYRATPQVVTAFGCAHPQDQPPKCQIVAGYALTPGVSKDHWDMWLAQNQEHPAVKNRLIFAYADSASVEAAASEHVKTRSGLERLDPKERLPRGVTSAAEKDAVEV